MSKPFLSLMCVGIGFIFGLLTAATLIEYEPPRVASHVIDSAIVLQIPKTDADLSMSIIYQEAELAMLREIQRQKNLSKGPSPAIPTSKTSTKPKPKTAPKGG